MFLLSNLFFNAGDKLEVAVRESCFEDDFAELESLFPIRNSAGLVLMVQH